jgi:cytochrome c551/c552
MKKALLLIITLVIYVSPGFADESGEKVFKSLGCQSCHHPESTSKLNPSLQEISHAYQDKASELIDFLNGQADAIVKPEKASMMKRYVEKTKSLTEADRKALADFIMEHR